MITIIIPESEGFNENTNEFITYPSVEIRLEHSLVSISKWESKWHKAFLSKGNKSLDEIVDYIKCMTISQNVNPHVYTRLTNENIKAITDYIDDPMTATTISDNGPQPPSREVITAELIYYWMITHNIPFECQKWHLNRLLTLIRVCSIKNTPAKKMGKHSVMSRNNELNAMRRKALNTRG